MRNNIILFIGTVFFVSTSLAIDSNKVMGPEECTECHDVENTIWEETHHFATYENMPEQDEALAIAEKLGIDDVIESEMCQTCHLTVKTEEEENEIIAGVSCESCHGAGKDWIEVHSEEDKSAEQAKTIWAQAEESGMIRPNNLVKLAGNCLDCHMVKDEKLVNDGGHNTGSEFNLITYSQGEVRHNTFHSDNGENRKASDTKKRKMLVIGVSLELQRAIVAYASAKSNDGDYAQAMLKRIEKTKALVTSISATKADPTFAEIQSLAQKSPAKDLTENQSIAKEIEKLVLKIQKSDANSWQALDEIIAGLGEHKGEVQE